MRAGSCFGLFRCILGKLPILTTNSEDERTVNVLDINKIEKFCWFEEGGIPDEIIDRAAPFEDHNPRYLQWPAKYWTIPGKVPDHNIERNAWHVKYMAAQMILAGNKWISRPLSVFPCLLHVQDGNHRFRAYKWLQSKNIVIDLGGIVIYHKSCWRPECKKK